MSGFGSTAEFSTSKVGTIQSWLWTLAYGHHEDRTPIYGYEPTREAAMAASAKSWRRDSPAPPLARPLVAPSEPLDVVKFACREIG